MLNMDEKVVVVGGGAAGMEAAGTLAEAGCRVRLIEKESITGGHVKEWYHLFPDRRDSSEVINYLEDQILHKNITVRKDTMVEGVERMKGSFVVRTSGGDEI